MKLKILSFIILGIAVIVFGCGSNKEQTPAENKQDNKGLMSEDASSEKAAALDSKGVGKFSNVELGTALDKTMAEGGLKVYDLKCSACHKLTDEKLVGPGWKNVTSRRKAEWVMNFATNTDEMLNKDPAAQSMLEECLVRMPNQNLSDGDARNIYEFMRKNDGVK